MDDNALITLARISTQVGYLNDQILPKLEEASKTRELVIELRGRIEALEKENQRLNQDTALVNAKAEKSLTKTDVLQDRCLAIETDAKVMVKDQKQQAEIRKWKLLATLGGSSGLGGFLGGLAQKLFGE